MQTLHRLDSPKTEKSLHDRCDSITTTPGTCSDHEMLKIEKNHRQLNKLPMIKIICKQARVAILFQIPNHQFQDLSLPL